MSFSRNLLVHIGYHKTGSTYLQRTIFGNPVFGFQALPRRREVVRPVRLAGPDHYDAAAVRRLLEEECDEVAADGFKPVLSSEGLSGSIVGHGFDGERTLERLSALAPHAKILIIIREQKSMLLSRHNQFIKKGGRESFQEFIGHAGDISTHGHRKQLRYHHLISAYQEAFGTGQVCVLPYELLRNDPTAYMRSIMDFCDLPVPQDVLAETTVVNPSMLPKGKALLRWTNTFVAQGNRAGTINDTLLPLSKPRSKRVRNLVLRISDWLPNALDQKFLAREKSIIREEIGTYYAASNAKTAQLTGLDLAAYGYDM